MPSLYASHDVLTLPSRFEPFGIAFVEALARGIPCVARDDFAMPELVRHGDNGALVKDDDPVALARAISDVLRDPGIFERCEAQREEVARRYSWDFVAREMASHIAAAVG